MQNKKPVDPESSVFLLYDAKKRPIFSKKVERQPYCQLFRILGHRKRRRSGTNWRRLATPPPLARNRTKTQSLCANPSEQKCQSRVPTKQNKAYLVNFRRTSRPQRSTPGSLQEIGETRFQA